ncbi:putative 4-hydroxy-tetrahydrodipicolinate reductase [Rosa chinensis]|uniref:Putative 4-hydroxy-tetrahydrodipicolinate reductase n=1 Tax=Rosa chinensis TaxID=74649 RepID=A0A2P6SMW8_ROSCH|nr:putative 4-hydroxy-tetrahydrodipicolinate reductase [Rosa chinensis]
MVALSCQFQPVVCKSYRNGRARPSALCSMQPSQNNIKVIINGAAKEIGRAAVMAVTRARGMEVAGAVDSYLVGEDIGNVCDMAEPLEIPLTNDLTMVLGSISQSKATGVVVDFTDPSKVYDNVKQATAFGMRSVVYVPKIKLDTVSALSALCEKASMGCLVAPTLSIGSILLQQAAISASFHYNNVEIVESRANATDLPSSDATQIANNLSNLGQIYNREDISTDVKARGQVLGEDGVRVHSLVLPGLPSSTTVYFSRPGEVYTLKHDITDVQSLMPGLILAIRKIVRIKPGVWPGETFMKLQAFFNLIDVYLNIIYAPHRRFLNESLTGDSLLKEAAERKERRFC